MSKTSSMNQSLPLSCTVHSNTSDLFITKTATCDYLQTWFCNSPVGCNPCLKRLLSCVLQARKKLPGLVLIQIIPCFPAASEKFQAPKSMAGQPLGCRVTSRSRFAWHFPGFSAERLAFREPPCFSANGDGWLLILWDLLSGCISTLTLLHLLLYSVLHPYQLTHPTDWPFSLPPPHLCPCFFPLPGRHPSPAVLWSRLPLWRSVMSPSPWNPLPASLRAQSYHGLHRFTRSLCFSQLSYSLSLVEQTWAAKLLMRRVGGYGKERTQRKMNEPM